jgi:hypothetical protein
MMMTTTAVMMMMVLDYVQIEEFYFCHGFHNNCGKKSRTMGVVIVVLIDRISSAKDAEGSIN